MKNMNPFGFTLEEIKIEDIKPHPSNPRQISKRNKRELGKSIDTFGFIDKPILNKDLVTIAGHQRIEYLKDLDVLVVECYVPKKALTNEQVLEFMVRHNKNTGFFDIEKLNDYFKRDDLVDWGFTFQDLESNEEAERKDEKQHPKIQARLFEHQDYIIFVFENQQNFINVCSRLGIGKVNYSIIDSKTKIGVGRVLKGDTLVKLTNGEG